MTPEAGRFLDKAQKLLDHAATMLKVDLNEDAGRTAYLAGFHAAQAFIFESAGKVFKSHNGIIAYKGGGFSGRNFILWFARHLLARTRMVLKFGRFLSI